MPVIIHRTIEPCFCKKDYIYLLIHEKEIHSNLKHERIH